MTDQELEDLRTEFRSHCEAFGATFKAAHGHPPDGSAILRALVDIMAQIIVQAPKAFQVQLFSKVTLALALEADLDPEQITNYMQDKQPARLDS